MATRRTTPAPAETASGTLYLVATPIGNLRDITLRALDVLREVALVAAEDTRRIAKLLTHYDIRTRTCSLHAHNERRRLPGLLERLHAGESIALVTDAGTPLISDPGLQLVREALTGGIRVEPVPGASAVVAAASMSGLVEREFTFLGFPPSRSKDRIKWVASLANETRPLIFFEAPHRIKRTLLDIAEVLGDIEIAVCREITKVHEELVKGPITTALSLITAQKGEFTIVISAPSTRSSESSEAPTSDEIWQYFGHITELCGSRREAIRLTAGHFGLKTKDVYSALERAKIE